MARREKSLAELVAQNRVTAREAAQMIGISYPTVLKLCNEGYLRSITIGSTRYVTTDELRRFLEEGNYIPPTTDAEPEESANG